MKEKLASLSKDKKYSRIIKDKEYLEKLNSMFRYHDIHNSSNEQLYESIKCFMLMYDIELF